MNSDTRQPRRPYPRERNNDVRAYERRMEAVDPGHRLPLVDYWDPDLADQLENVRAERGGWMCGDLGDLTLRYRRSRWRDMHIDLEILDRSSGRRLRQDGSMSEELFVRLRELAID